MRKYKEKAEAERKIERSEVKRSGGKEWMLGEKTQFK